MSDEQPVRWWEIEDTYLVGEGKSAQTAYILMQGAWKKQDWRDRPHP